MRIADMLCVDNPKSRLILLLVASFLVFSVFGCTWAVDTLAQDNEAKAREHYLIGESAMKSGDLLTAVVEFETVLRLKPTSAYTAKLLEATAPKLGDDGKEAHAHYNKAADLQAQGKLDDAGTELGLALKYNPKGQTPKCLTDKALELAQLQKEADAKKPVATPEVKPTVATTGAKSAVTAEATKSTAKSATTKKKTTATAASTTSNKTTTAHKSTVKQYRPPVYRQPRSYHMPVSHSRSRLTYVHGYTVNGHKVPGHYAIKPYKR